MYSISIYRIHDHVRESFSRLTFNKLLFQHLVHIIFSWRAISVDFIHNCTFMTLETMPVKLNHDIVTCVLQTVNIKKSGCSIRYRKIFSSYCRRYIHHYIIKQILIFPPYNVYRCVIYGRLSSCFWN